MLIVDVIKSLFTPAGAVQSLVFVYIVVSIWIELFTAVILLPIEPVDLSRVTAPSAKREVPWR